jgi:uncharacterized lipoprotein YajG
MKFCYLMRSVSGRIHKNVEIIVGCFIIISVGILLIGCAAGRIHRNVNLNYDPTINGSLRSLKPVNVSLEVIDQRGPAEKDVVERNQSITHYSALSLETALKKELENNGHRVVSVGSQNGQVFLRIKLTQFLAGTKEVGGGSAFQKIADMQATVEVSRAGQELKVSYAVSTDRMLIFPLFAPGGISMVANPAFNEFVNKIVTDPVFLTIMKGN